MSINKQRTTLWAAALVALGTIGMLVWQSPLFGAEAAVVIAPPAIDNPKTAGPLQTAVLAGGCFWGATSAEYDDRPGPVRDAIVAALDGWLAELERQARIAGSAAPGLLAFELYAVVMGANSRYRLKGDRQVFEYARGVIDRLLGELPG